MNERLRPAQKKKREEEEEEKKVSERCRGVAEKRREVNGSSPRSQKK